MGFISNFFDFIGDVVGDVVDEVVEIIEPEELLVEQDPASLPFLPPLCEETSIKDEKTSYVIKESSESKTGEDYDIYTKDTNEPFMRIRGTMLSRIPGFDHIKCCTWIEGEDGEKEPTQVAKLERKDDSIVLVRDTEKWFDSQDLCWVVSKPDSEDTFIFYSDEEKSTKVYKMKGDVVHKTVHMKNANDEIVAIINNLTSEDNVESYEVNIAKGMDVVFVLCCVCAVDEEADEQREKRQKQEEE